MSINKARENLYKERGADFKTTPPKGEAELVTALRIYALSGEIPCLLDAPAEGREFLETALRQIAGETSTGSHNQQLEVEKKLQKFHEHFRLKSANLEDFEGRETVIRECCKCYDRLARILFKTGDVGEAMHCVYRNVNLAEMLGPSDELAKAYATIAFVLKSTKFGKAAGDAALAMSESSPTVAYSMTLYGKMLVGEGEFQLAETKLKMAISAATDINDAATLGLSMSELGWCYFVQGKFDKSLPLAKEMQELGIKHDDERFRNWGLCNEIRDLTEMGEEVTEDLRRRLDEYMDKFKDKMLQDSKVELCGLRIRLLAGTGGKREREGVRKVLEENEEVLKAMEENPCSQITEFAGEHTKERGSSSSSSSGMQQQQRHAAAAACTLSCTLF